MNKVHTLALVSLLLVFGASNGADSTLKFEGQTDANTGPSAREWLKEQTEGINRGETEPYRAESAGKAYRVYIDSIGAKDQQAPSSQISTIRSD